jgi:hypothetical protein
MSLEFDLGPLWTNTNEMIATFLPVFAIGGGIAIAVALLGMVINMVVKSVKGGVGSR